MKEWYVYREDHNANAIKPFNVFKHTSFAKAVEEAIQQSKNYAIFKEAIDREAMYYFWCKCEHEVIISEWPPVNKERFPDRKEIAIKVDIYDQLHLNWEAFCRYCWEN